MAKQSRALVVIPEPAPNTRTVFPGTGKGPTVRGTGAGAGPLDYVCGSCGATILESVSQGQFQNIVFRCWKCGKFNDIVGVDELN